jgi:phosphatidylserine/phosphatidylglycerophosphate/cardiolipin synthase-like enzyme
VSLVPSPLPAAVADAGKPEVTVACNNDQAVIAWQYRKPIIDCVGFAIFRKLNHETDAQAEPLKNKVGFADEPFKKGDQKPTTEWPIQRFTWTDFTVSEGDTVSYMVVPMLYDGAELKKDAVNVSDWTSPLKIATGLDDKGNKSPYSAYFNRGLVSSQFFSRMKHDLAGELPGKTVKSIIEGDNNKLRDFLGGYLDNRLFALLDEIIANKKLTVFGALYELHQKDLVAKLKSIGNRAHIILANGAAKKQGEDKNSDSRQEIKDAGVEVFDRIVDVTKKHFAHNKFLVIVDENANKRVWTGSTNWTPGGMFSQVNNGLLIEDTKVGEIYLAEWTALKKDVEQDNNGYGDDLYNSNLKANAFPTANSRMWFSPTRDFADLKDVEKIMENARQGILFLMFNPGPRNTFFNYIQDLQGRKPDLFIHGVINQDPGGSAGNELVFFHQGQTVESDWNAVLPKTVDHEFSFWYQEVSAGMVTIHSKVLVIDPFGDEPYVVTGSHNFGPKASSTNDDNLNVINDKSLARQYAVNVMAVYDHYRWRYSLFSHKTTFTGLTKDREWMSGYMGNDLRMKELKFWM